MLRSLYDWSMRMAAHRLAVWWMAAVSFIESSVFPIPPDVMLIPMVLAERAKAWFYATVCTAASVAGGFLGYAIGLFLFGSVGVWVVETYGLAAEFERFRDTFNQGGFLAVLIAGFTPVPYKLITITAGVTGLDVAVFALASVLARGARFFLVAGLLWRFGPPIRALIERHFGLLTSALMVMLVGGFFAIKLL